MSWRCIIGLLGFVIKFPLLVNRDFHASGPTIGYESIEYKRIGVKVRGQSFTLGLHQLSFWAHHDFEPLDWANHVSHLCHLQSCVDPNHLNSEKPYVNLNRKECLKNKICHSHGSEPDCIL